MPDSHAAPAVKYDPPFRADHVGSLLRPRALKDAVRARGEGRLDDAGLSSVLDDAVVEAIRLQEDSGMQAITDGEFRRGSWFLGFVDAVEGLKTEPSQFQFQGDHGAWHCPFAAGRLARTKGITTHEYEFIRDHTDRTPKVTMPSPTAMIFWLGRRGAADTGAYPDIEEYLADLTRIFREEIAELHELGCRYVQLDEVPIAMLCDPAVRQVLADNGEDAAATLDMFVDLIREALRDRPADMTIAMHLCRGNYKGQWMASGGYDSIAEKLFREVPVDAFFLEYDSERAGDFVPLDAMPADKRVVLGLVSTKVPESPSKAELVARIEAAAEHVPLDRLAISPQCGFASSVGGNPVTEADERAKLSLCAEVAAEVWGA